MFCQNCGKEISAETIFCSHCGTRQGENVQSVSSGAQPVCSQREVTTKAKPKSKGMLIGGIVLVCLAVLWIIDGIFFNDNFSGIMGDSGLNIEKLIRMIIFLVGFLGGGSLLIYKSRK